MSGFLDTLTQALEGAPLVALGAALLWGVLSVILSPCHLASIPLLVGYIAGQGLVKPRRAFILSTLFALGLLLVIALIGVITAALGRIVGDLGGWTNYLVAAVFFPDGALLARRDPFALLGQQSPGDAAERALGGFSLGSLLRIGPWPMHLRLYGSRTGGDFPSGGYRSALCGNLALGLWPGALRGYHRSGDVGQRCSGSLKMERKLPRGSYPASPLRSPGTGRRLIPDLHRSLNGSRLYRMDRLGCDHYGSCYLAIQSSP